MLTQLIDSPVSQLRKIAAHFQRSINVTYDAGNETYIAGYIPTEAGAIAIANVLRNVEKSLPQRAHVFHAPYGSGKSLLSLVLGASAENTSSEALDLVLKRLHHHNPEQAATIKTHLDSQKRLLPIYLLGNEGSLHEALTRALTLAVSQLGLSDLRPRTQFKAALSTIERWERHYPAVYQQLSASLVGHDLTVEMLQAGLLSSTLEMLTIFEKLYEQLTAGARFDKHEGVKLKEIFSETVQGLQAVGYDGVMVIWDEFGRFMEAKSSQAFGLEADQLQDFAEFCSRSGDAQVHLVLITHRQLATYAADLPDAYQKKWSRIAERFWSHDITSDPAILYRLIGEALETTDNQRWHNFLATHQQKVAQLAQRTATYRLFSDATNDDVIEQLWPLHPLTAYALPRLTRAVAQNERTLFTFLAGDEANTVQTHLHNLVDWSLVNIDILWDYFADGIRADRRVGGTHSTWSGVNYALQKIAPDDKLSRHVIKALGVLRIVGDVNVQTQTISGCVIPSTEMLAWALDAEQEAIRQCLYTLSRHRVIAQRSGNRISGEYWEFIRGSDVDLTTEVANLLGTQSPSRLQLRQLLQTEIVPPTYLPRNYNLDRCMTRFFTTIYRWGDELPGVGGDEFLKRLHPAYGIADGVVVFVLVGNSAEHQTAIETITQLPPSRAIFVVPERPLLLNDALKELFALRDLQNNPQFMAQDERLQEELNFFIEDAQQRIHHTLTPFFQAQEGQSTWYSHDGKQWHSQRVKSASKISRLLSDRCYQWHPHTPTFNIESLNLHKPSKIQLNAAERMINQLVRRVTDDIYPLDLGIDKSKPERLIARTMLVQTGLLQQVDNGDGWQLVQPETGKLAKTWASINNFLDSAVEDEQGIASLIDELQMPPFGIRRGVLPVLLAAAMRPRLNVLTIRRNRKVITPVTGATFTQLCLKPDEFTVELGVWDARRATLWRTLENQILTFLAVSEQEQQPLSYLSLGLLRWLRSQPRYSRDTNTVSGEAQQLRHLIRKAHDNPTTVLFHDLLDLLEDGTIVANDEKYEAHLAQRLSALMSQINASYSGLLYELDRYAEESFAHDATRRQRDGQSALRYWVTKIEQEANQPVEDVRFSDPLVERFVNVIYDDVPIGQFWERLGRALVGVTPADWNDGSVDTFKELLLQVQERLRRELFGLGENDQVIELVVNRPDQTESSYRFRSSDLSQQGQNILANFKTTMAISGRPLSPDEKRQVALAFLHFMLEGEEQGRERKNKSHRVHK